MKQDDRYVKARDKVRKVVNFSKILGAGRCATYVKITGNIYNGQRNPDLNQKDIYRIRQAVKSVNEALNEFEQELNRIAE